VSRHVNALGPDQRQMLAIAADLLDQGSRLDRLSRILTLGGLAGLAGIGVLGVWPGLLCGAVALAGLVEFYLATRVAFDAALFRRLATAMDGPDWPSFDAAMIRLGLLPAAKAGRAAEARISGAVRLLRMQAVALIVQMILLGALAASGVWLR
jgi:hypothetical protein